MRAIRISGDRRRAWSCAVSILGLAVAGHASAQAMSDFREPERSMFDPLGIEVTMQVLERNDTLLTIGDPSAGGLKWTYHGLNSILSQDFGGTLGPAGGNDPTTYVNVGYHVAQFTGSDAAGYTNAVGTSATLVKVSGGYVYTEADGTVFSFTTSAYPALVGPLLTSIKQPNGMLTTLNIQYASDCSAVGTMACDYTIASAVTNTGFAFKFDTSTSRVDAVNMLAHTCDAQALSCAAYDNYVTLASGSDPSMGTPGTVMQVTDSLGNSWHYRGSTRFAYLDVATQEPVRGPRVIWAFKDPTGYMVQLNFNSAKSGAVYPDGHLLSVTDPRGTFTYTSSYNNDGINSSSEESVYDPSGAFIYESGGDFGAPGGYQNGLGSHVITYGYTGAVTAWNSLTQEPAAQYTRIVSATRQEGDYDSFGYDARGNINSVTHTAKSGSGLSATVETASYPSSCSSLITCNKPTWTKDALGNETDYTYDPTHGGMLTVTSPADQNGLRKRTYNTYTAFNTGNGSIYRLTRSETCGLSAAQLSLTACPAATTTAVVTTDYGTSSTAPYTYKSFQPYSVTQTDGAGSLSATTTYTYDVMGNVTVIDGPRTDVDDRSYKTYDANRRVVFEIGVLPGGGPQRTVTRHTYDGAGRETRTDVGYANTNATDGSDFVVTAFTRKTYDAAGRLIKTEQVQP
jgi:hypothetical protein